jgi:hypothetical protein
LGGELGGGAEVDADRGAAFGEASPKCWHTGVVCEKRDSPECWSRMLEPAAVPVIFAAWAARFVAGRWARRVAGTGTVRQKPAGQGLAGFSLINRSGVREAASRTGRRNSAGAGTLGGGRPPEHSLGAFGGAALGGRRREAALSKNSNWGWNFLEGVG